MTEMVWTEVQFDEMSWHDNHVHGLRIVETANGAGELILDLDHILEWITTPDRSFQFRVVPATLTFHDVMFLRMSLDYATPTAAFGPFSIGGIKRRSEPRERHVEQVWSIQVKWPAGELGFSARGFTQRTYGTPIVCSSLSLTPSQRSGA
jgi:hypothetical protein